MHIWTRVQHNYPLHSMHIWTRVQHMLYTICTFEQGFSIIMLYTIYTFEQWFSSCSTQYAHMNKGSAYALHYMHIWTRVQHMLHTHGTNWSKGEKVTTTSTKIKRTDKQEVKFILKIARTKGTHLLRRWWTISKSVTSNNRDTKSEPRKRFYLFFTARKKKCQGIFLAQANFWNYNIR